MSKETEITRVRDGVRGYQDFADSFQEIRERFCFFTENAPDAIIVLDESARILLWNATAAEVFGYTEEEALGKQVHLLLCLEGDCVLFEEFLQNCIGSSRGDKIEFFFVRKDGCRMPVEVSSSGFQMGGSLRSLMFARDVSERKAVEQEIIDAKERLEFMLKSCRAAIYAARPYGHYQSTYKSESIKDITGYEPSDFTENPDFWLTQVHPEDADFVHKEVENIFERGKYEYEYEYRFRHKDGTYRWIRDEMRLVRDEEGNPKEIVGSLSDITELSIAREQIEASREQLRSLAARVESVREGERRKIAREIHDEFGQALTGLKIELRWLEKNIPDSKGEFKERMSSMLEIIDSNIELVRRISSELRPGVLDDLGLAAAVEWQVDEFSKKTGIECLLSSTLLEVRYDDDTSTALFRILQEAITNVARHTEANRVEVELGELDGHLVLEVRDNGRGIEQSELNNVDSLGILSMRERAQMLGGEVVIEGVRGKSTTVRVQLPVKTHELGSVEREMHSKL